MTECAGTAPEPAPVTEPAEMCIRDRLCSDVVLHIRVIIAVHLGEVADISGVSVKDSLYRYGVALMCLYNRCLLYTSRCV